MTDSRMNFQNKAPKIPPRILCIGMPVRDLTFHTPGVPGRGSKENATAFDEICGGNALSGAIGIVRLGGRASICGPMGDARKHRAASSSIRWRMRASRRNISSTCRGW
jgi:hypothetical protein